MLRLFKDYLRPYWKCVALTLLVTIIEYTLQICVMLPVSKKIIDEGVAGQDYSAIWRNAGLMLGVTVLIGVCSVIVAYFSSRATAGFTCSLHRACFRKVNRFSPQDFAKFGESTLLSRTISDVSQLCQMMINALRIWLMVPIVIILELIMIAKLDFKIFLILTVVFLLTIAFLVVFGVRSRKGFEKLQKRIDRINLLMREKLVGVRPIRAFCNEELEDAKLNGAFNDSYETAIAANRKINFLSPIALVIMNWTVVIIYLVGTGEIRRGMASVSSLILIFQYISSFIASLAMFPFMINMLPKVSVSTARINELLDYEGVEETRNKEGAVNPELSTAVSSFASTIETPAGEGTVEFKNVIFGYNGALDVIADVSFKAEAGKTTAFIGATGSGKTTIMNLMQGLYYPNFGEILLDGKNIREYREEALRGSFAYGTQRPMIFQDTVRGNITSEHTPESEARMQAACDAACFTEVLANKPEKYDFKLAQGGMNISGGQRQRLSLARTVARDVPIYVFDDSFSALDAQTEQKALTAIRKMLAGRTIIMVAQKISTIKHADNIIVLEKGRIAGQGKHEELLETCPVYYDIFRTQCSLN